MDFVLLFDIKFLVIVKESETDSRKLRKLDNIAQTTMESDIINDNR